MGATERIIERLVPEWIEHQKRKAKDYNSKKSLDDFGIGIPQVFENADVLGVPGQFAEIWRKIWKLKKGMWDREKLVGESVREILLDLIGHCFLAVDMIDRLEPMPGGKFGDTGPVEEPVGKGYADFMAMQRCGSSCRHGHTYVGVCKLRRSPKTIQPQPGEFPPGEQDIP